MLQAALDELWKTNNRFCLNIYFKPAKLSPYMKPHNRYTYSELETVFDNTDLLIAPSIWYETFGYVVLEALSCGVPVLISGHVGAKDILAQGAGIVMEEITAVKLRDLLNGLTSQQLSAMNKTILEDQEIPTIRQIASSIEEQCYFQKP